MNTRAEEVLISPMFSEELGPAQSVYPGFFKVQLNLDGARISSLSTKAGYLKRNTERRLSQTSWAALSAVAGKINGESPIFAELATCLAIEKLLNITVSDRVSFVRILVSELSRISSHLRFLANLGKSVGQLNLFHYALRDREAILDLLELVSGSRYGSNYVRIGGVSSDVSEGFVERVLELLEMMNFRLKEYNDLFSFNLIFVERAQANGLLTASTAQKFGVTGPNARSVGISTDFRKAINYCRYDMVDFEIPLGIDARDGISDIHDRMIIRLREIAVSIGILKQVLKSLPEGSVTALDMRKVSISEGTAKVSVESPQGEFCVELGAKKGKETPDFVRIKAPSKASFSLLPEVAKRAPREDLALVIASLDLSISEVDL